MFLFEVLRLLFGLCSRYFGAFSLIFAQQRFELFFYLVLHLLGGFFGLFCGLRGFCFDAVELLFEMIHLVFHGHDIFLKKGLQFLYELCSLF